ncbi:MAG: ATP synthase subunit I [Acidobacteria bacterium]|nr:ATP synthase subunit I [Acidobacteriota bacterium]
METASGATNAPDPIPLPPDQEKFLSGSGRRMYRFMLVLGVTGTAVCWVWYGWRWAAGFAVGSALSALNFHWMYRAIDSITRSFLPQGRDENNSPVRPPGAAGSALRIMLRYALIGAAGYAIFVSSFISLEAFFAGLFLFVGAVLVEVCYELWRGLSSP